MDPSEPRPSPRREVQLQGPRPTPLKVSKDSHKIRKPPVAPSQQQPLPPPPQQQQQQPRAPVIIYAVSPKVIHTDPGDFMSLVQRLTGASPTSLYPPAAAAAAMATAPPTPAGSLSPAARFAAFERSGASSDADRPLAAYGGRDDVLDQLGISGGAAADVLGGLPGILSPLPSALPPISPSFFAPLASDPAALGFLNEMSPVFRGPRGFVDGPFMPSPGNLLLTPTALSPGALWDILGQL